MIPCVFRLASVERLIFAIILPVPESSLRGRYGDGTVVLDRCERTKNRVRSAQVEGPGTLDPDVGRLAPGLRGCGPYLATAIGLVSGDVSPPKRT